MFFLASGLIAMLVGAILIFAGRANTTSVDAPAQLDVALYKEQLAAVDADLDRGTLLEAEAQAMRAEIGRRLIAADRKAMHATDRRHAKTGWILPAVVAASVLVGAFLTYGQLGAPAYPDLPLIERLQAAEDFRNTRPSQALVEVELGLPAVDPDPPAEVVASLNIAKSQLAETPDDIDALVALATAHTQMGNFKPAYEAMAEVLRLQGDDARAEQWTGFGLLQVYALQGQYVSPEAEAAFNRALQLNQDEPMARYYIGLLYAQTDRPDVAFRFWRPLIEAGPPQAPWVALASERIEAVAAAAGIRYSLPDEPSDGTGLRGPSAEDVEAASSMSQADQTAMIEGMVASLSDRLATEGGPPEAWERLIRSYLVLDRRPQAQGVLNEARKAFASDQAVLDRLGAIAQESGLE